METCSLAQKKQKQTQTQKQRTKTKNKQTKTLLSSVMGVVREDFNELDLREVAYL